MNTRKNKNLNEPAQERTQDSLESWLILSHTPGIYHETVSALLTSFDSIDDILGADHQQLADAAFQSKIKPDIVEALLKRQTDAYHADLEWASEDNHHIITQLDPRYPQQIATLNDAPPVLYVRGDADYLNQPQLAIVGSRNPTAAGRNSAKQFAQHLSDAGITVTSGLASGIDGASHEGALAGLAGTIAVVAHGLDIIYPAKHQDLAQKITRNGAVISEMPIGIAPHRGLFPKRNRIISALSLGTLVVEAALKSGSLITARFALEQNREVFAIPGSIHNPMAKGCHQLIRQGAKLVETAADILEELSISLQNPSQYPQKTGTNTQENLKDTKLALDPDHQKLLKCLAYEPASIDELVNRSDFSAAEVASMLLILELEGNIVCQDGRYTNIV